MSNDEYQRRVTVGQAINLANSYILAVDLKDGKDISFDGYRKLLQGRTEEFKAMTEAIQESYKNAEKAMPVTTATPPPTEAPQPTFKFG